MAADTGIMLQQRHQPAGPEIFADDKSLQIDTQQSVSQTGVLDHNLQGENDKSSRALLADSTTDGGLERWNKPTGNIARYFSVCFSMFVYGLNDAAYGALVPYFESYYNLSYTVVSLIFLAPFVGYTIAAFTNAQVHAKLGQRGIALIGPGCHVLTYVVLALHPPWPVVVVFGAVGGVGGGLIDAAWSAWAGHMQKGNALEGILHASYAVGCTFSPLIATSMIVKAKLEWYEFYYFMIGMGGLEWLLCGTTFWQKNAARYRHEHPQDENIPSSTRAALTHRVTWLCSAFFLVYVGAEVALGGWIVSFMLRVRGASPYASGLTATGFWAGMAVGRAFLGLLTEFLSHRVGERICITFYLAVSISMELIFWLVPHFLASAVAVALLGAFIGPIFPSGIIMATKLLPSHMHVSSIGFSTAIGGTGGAIFPFVVGVIAQAKGVQVLQPITLTLLVVLLLLWFCFPRLKKEPMHAV